MMQRCKKHTSENRNIQINNNLYTLISPQSVNARTVVHLISVNMTMYKTCHTEHVYMYII